jgi:hypothetical protein
LVVCTLRLNWPYHSDTIASIDRFCLGRALHSSPVAFKPHTPTSAINSSDYNPSTTTPKTAIAQQGSNQLSLETPANGAGQFCFPGFKDINA